MKVWTLTRTKQCRNCPWRKDSDLTKIPGYSRKQHEDLTGTIAESEMGHQLSTLSSLRVMACHESSPQGRGSDHCVGWLHNQLGVGNNIPLRISVSGCTNMREMITFGPQFMTLEGTIRRYE